MDKPKDIKDYTKWLKDELHVELSNKNTNHYNSVTSSIKSTFENSDFWLELNNNITAFDQEYLKETSFSLFVPNFQPHLLVKGYSSFFEKTYRKNVIYNKHWPSPPRNWITPDNWFESINDILRTNFVVRYLDGVEFLISKISDLGSKHGLDFQISYEAKDEGYYAVHMYTKFKFEIPKLDFDTEFKQIQIEIQVTTQLQDVISKLTHMHYEKRRKLIIEDNNNKKWQWNYKSDEFSVNYLGHILHYIEGMIMEVIKKTKKENVQ